MDDWEWGVDLFADDPVVFKKLIYEMRFDEVSAVYALFGQFFIGVRLPVEKLGGWVEGGWLLDASGSGHAAVCPMRFVSSVFSLRNHVNREVTTIAKNAHSPKINPSHVQEPLKTGCDEPAARGPLAKERVDAILKGLDEAYPDAVCALDHRTPWELLVATILSAQCTDVRVNMVTPELFRRFPTPQAMAKATLPELEELIRTTGFFRNKAKSIQGAAKKIIGRLWRQGSARRLPS